MAMTRRAVLKGALAAGAGAAAGTGADAGPLTITAMRAWRRRCNC